jgi:environmental stress-induced protein Ves
VAPSVIRFADAVVARWRNGQGETREIARFPAEGDPAWRLSMATVNAESAFSSFPGVERRLGVVDGGSLSLTIDGEDVVAHPGGPSVAFHGTDPVSARPLAEPVLDLNLMTGEGFFGMLDPIAAAVLEPAGQTVLLVSLVDGMRVDVSDGSGSGAPVTLERLDTLLVPGSDGATLLQVTAPRSGPLEGFVGYLARIIPKP